MTIAEHFIEKGRHEGWQKGTHYGIRRTAKRMLQAGCDRQFIVDVTGLLAAELASLAGEVETV